MANQQPTSEEEIDALPRLARSAFTARCARRVQPLFKFDWPDSPEYVATGVDDAITLTERFAANPNSVAQNSLAVAESAASNAADVSLRLHSASVASAVADAAAHAIFPIAYNEATTTFHAYESAVVAARAAAGRATSAIRSDFDLIAHISKSENWTDNTPVPPEFFGPMWPDGPPEG